MVTLRRRKRPVHRLGIESLESRQLLASDLSSQGLPPDFTLDTWEVPSIGHFAELQPLLGDVHALTGVKSVRNVYGLDGRGQTVAVIDSGVAWDHQALGGGFGSGYTIVGGWDFAENDAYPYDDGPAGFHGTHVTGIIASRNVTYVGVAPGVDIVALRVFNDVGAGYFSWVEQALRWVYNNRNAFRYPITTVNMSLGTEWNSTSVPSWSTIEDELSLLKAANIVITVAAGNSFAQYQTPGLSYPASSPYVIPVMSVSNRGTLSSFSQRHTRAMGAPGEQITSTVPDHTFGADGVANDFGTASGTSMAAPYLAGVTTLVRQAMQFARYGSITPDTIYQHLRNTADTLYDAITRTNYLRVNVQRAIDALMPADDYGSSVDTAHRLGLLAGNTTLSGHIHRLDDADYVTFTAAASGTAQITVTASDWLAPRIELVGGGTWNGTTATFSVVAGQTYTVGLRTTNGIGHYELKLQAPSTASVIDWGTVNQQVRQGVSVGGGTVYQIIAGRDGVLTVEATGRDGQVGLEIRSGAQQLLGQAAAGASVRVDLAVRAGHTLYVRLTGSATQADLRLTNLVQINRTEWRISGTAESDSIAVQLGSNLQVGINGTVYRLGTGVSRLTLSGGGGSDELAIWGSSANETITLAPQTATVMVGRFSVSATGFASIDVWSGGGRDIVTLNDSTGDDRLEGDYPSWRLSGAGYQLRVHEFTNVNVVASRGTDTARLLDSAGHDTYTAYPTRAVLQGTTYRITLQNFDRVSVDSVNGGRDVATLYDSAGNDQFRADPQSSVMEGFGYRHEVTGFAQVTAIASRGYDVTLFSGSVGQDTYEARSNGARLSATTFDIRVQGFDDVQADGLEGNDRAVLIGGRGSDFLQASPQTILFVSQGVTHRLSNFEELRADGGGGRDTAILSGSSIGDTFYGYPSSAWLAGAGYRLQVDRFSQLTVYGAGGDDTAYLYGTGRGDRLTSTNHSITLSGPGYSYTLLGFGNVAAYRSVNGPLIATLQVPVTAVSSAPLRLASTAYRFSWFVGAGSAAAIGAWANDRVDAYFFRSARGTHHSDAPLSLVLQAAEAARQLSVARQQLFSASAADAVFAQWM